MRTPETILRVYPARDGRGNMKKVLVKHQLTDAADLCVAYEVDEERKLIAIEVEHIDSYLLITFLTRLGQQLELTESEAQAYRIEVSVAGISYAARVATLPKTGPALERTLTLTPMRPA